MRTDERAASASATATATATATLSAAPAGGAAATATARKTAASSWDRDEAFRLLTEPHLDRMFSVSRRILGSDDLAWDAVQEGLTALWNEEREPVDPRGWLVKAVVHRSLHACRTLQRRRRHEDRAREIRDAVVPRPAPSDRAEREELREIVLAAMDELPPEFRRVLELREFRSMDYDAISKRTGTPVGTVRSRLNRARAALRKILDRRIGADWNR